MYSPSFAASSWLLLVLSANFVIKIESKSVFGIGTRILGDQLLLKDVLQTPPISMTEDPVIKFNYAIVEPITYIEIESDKNVYAIVNFSYEDNLVEGSISTVNGQLSNDGSKPEPFDVLIQIYGFNRTMLNVSPSFILNKDQQFNGVLKPNYQQQQQQKNHQSLSLMQEDLNALDDLEDYDDEDDDADAEDYEEDEDDFDENYDKVIEQGQRQEGDFLVYDISQTSASKTEFPTNHSLTFYYIDIYYITYVKFTIYEHFLNRSLNDLGDTYVVEYGHISPTTLKAVVTDHHTTNLFVQMQMYGFHPTELPVDYRPFLSNIQTPTTSRPLSSLRQLKILMNSQQSTTNAQQTQSQQHQLHHHHHLLHQEIQTNEDFKHDAATTALELGHQISPNNRTNINCMQQVVSSTSSSSQGLGNDSLSIFAHWSIFNSIVTIIVIMVFV